MKYGRAIVPVCLALGACASNPLPPANGVRATFDRSAQAIQVVVSNAQAPHDVFLIDPDGRQYGGVLTPISGPHVNYSAPPSIGLGLGGFGSGIGGGLGVGLPLGGPRATGVDDQYVASARFAVPPDYPQHWAQYHIQLHVGAQALELSAPAPTGS